MTKLSTYITVPPRKLPEEQERLWDALTILDELGAEYDVTFDGRQYKRIKINLDE